MLGDPARYLRHPGEIRHGGAVGSFKVLKILDPDGWKMLSFWARF
jgi:hypothetical protein